MNFGPASSGNSAQRCRLAVWIAVGAAAILVLSLTSSLKAQMPSWQAAIAKVSVDPKLTFDAKQPRAPGTAFVVALSGQTAFLVTAAHVVEGEPSPRVEFQVAPHKTFVAEVKGFEGGLEPVNPRALALLVVENAPSGLYALRLAAPANPSIGEEIVVAGYPRPKGQFFAPKTTVAGWEGQDLALSRETPEGFSGGPVIRGDSAIAIVYGNDPGSGLALISDTVATYLRGLRIPIGSGAPESDSAAAPESRGPSPGDMRTNPKDGQRYVWIPSGTFMMGCSPRDGECDADEKPTHPVTITRGFWMGQTPVTVGAFRRYTQSIGTSMPPEPKLQDQKLLEVALNPGWKEEMQPILNVTWHEAADFCAWAGIRLPTEAQWEYAARAGSTAARYGAPEEIAWYAENSRVDKFDSSRVKEGDQSWFGVLRGLVSYNSPMVVGQMLPNAWALYDMLGNVWEWTADWYNKKYYQVKDSQDPQGPPAGFYRVLRGGSWVNDKTTVRVSKRHAYGPRDRAIYLGFRCAAETIP